MFGSWFISSFVDRRPVRNFDEDENTADGNGDDAEEDL